MTFQQTYLLISTMRTLTMLATCIVSLSTGQSNESSYTKSTPTYGLGVNPVVRRAAQLSFVLDGNMHINSSMLLSTRHYSVAVGSIVPLARGGIEQEITFTPAMGVPQIQIEVLVGFCESACISAVGRTWSYPNQQLTMNVTRRVVSNVIVRTS
eukprot:m.74488 g.74488  ORF g.74488 m.74488 type:complete len:154 (+) comp16160_c0_seq4:143-604(+)